MCAGWDYTARMRIFFTLILPAIVCGLAGGFLLGRDFSAGTGAPAAQPLQTPTFHDMRVNPAHDYVGLIDADHPDIVRKARELGSVEEAYRFVSKEVRFVPFAPPGPVDKTLVYRTGSCLGKAALLGSLYRAMGMPSDDIRLVMGLVMTPNGPADHVWLDIEHRGGCLQQDPSGMLGTFEFNEFPGTRYVDTHVIKESFCFNDTDFAIVSQLNRYRGQR